MLFICPVDKNALKILGSISAFVVPNPREL